MPLFERKTKPLALTEAGLVYLEKAKEILDIEKDLTVHLNDLSSLQTGSLNIGGTHYLNAYILAPVLTAFCQHYPGININLIEATSNKLVTLLEDNALDFTFNCLPILGKKLKGLPAFEDTVLLAVPTSLPVNKSLKSYALSARDIVAKKHLLATHPALKLTPFAHTPFVALTKGNNLSARCSSFFTEASVTPPIVLTVTQLVTAYHLAKCGLGATIISDLMVKLQDKNLVYYKIDSPEALRKFNMVMLNKSYMSHAQKAFLETLRQFY